MLPFGKNFGRGRESISCPVSFTNTDSQAWVMNYPVTREQMATKLDLKNIYSENIDVEYVKAMEGALKIRKSKIESLPV